MKSCWNPFLADRRSLVCRTRQLAPSFAHVNTEFPCKSLPPTTQQTNSHSHSRKKELKKEALEQMNNYDERNSVCAWLVRINVSKKKNRSDDIAILLSLLPRHIFILLWRREKRASSSSFLSLFLLFFSLACMTLHTSSFFHPHFFLSPLACWHKAAT